MLTPASLVHQLPNLIFCCTWGLLPIFKGLRIAVATAITRWFPREATENDLSLRDAGGGHRAHTFDALEEFLIRARDAGLRVILFINPYHADYLLLIEQTGKWPLLEGWQRELVHVAERHQVPLWDFNVLAPTLVGAATRRRRPEGHPAVVLGAGPLPEGTGRRDTCDLI